MTFTGADLGVLGNLATAMGLLDADGDPNPAWFGAPDQSLKTMLADEGQRTALVAFVDEALGGADRETDAAGVVWLPVVNLTDPDLTVAVTLDDRPAAEVHVGLGVKVATSDPQSRSSLSLPLFRVAKSGHTVPTPFLLGTPAGRLRLATQITVDPDPPIAGNAHLGAIGIDVDLPSGLGGADPAFSLRLTALQMPGATTPRDVVLSAAGLGDLDDALLQLLFELVRQQAAAAGSPALAALTGVLGLAGDAVPAFPLDQLAGQGVSAVTTWLQAVVSAAPARQAWLGHLAGLVGGTRVGDEITFALGGTGTLRLGARLGTTAEGHAQLTPSVSLDLGTAAARVEARADLCRVDLVSGATTALPSLGVWAAAGNAGNRVLDVTNPHVVRADTLRVGFALDGGRRVTFELAADTVRIGTRDYPTLDLTSPDAVMDAAGNAVEDVANTLLSGLGGALGTVKVLVGLDPPPGHPTVPTISLADLLTDPLGAVAGHWQTVLSAHATAVPSVLTALRDVLAGAAVSATPVRGSGTVAEPWVTPLASGFDLELAVDGQSVSVAVAAGTRVDTLGQQCTVIEGRLAATVATIDLAARSASLLPGVDARLLFRERGANPSRAVLRLAEGLELAATHVGLRLSWTAGGGLAASVEAPALTLHVGANAIPVPVPVIQADGTVALPAEGWDAIEAVVGELAGLLPGFVGDLATMLGWRDPAPAAAGGRPGLRLADLVVDPAAALRAWLPELLLSSLGPRAIGVVADLLTRTGDVSGAVAGSGHPDDPYRLPIASSLPEPAAWILPAGLQPRATAAPEALRNWRPGNPGLSPDGLAEALRAEAAIAGDVADLVRGRDLAGGLAALAARWEDTDGRVAPPADPPAAIRVARAGVAAGQLLGRVDLEDELGRVATTVVYVDIGTSAWPAAPVGRRLDLTAAGLAPEMVTPPAPAAGEWFVALGERAACRLPSGDADGTAGQAARLGRVLAGLAPLGNDLVVVALGGAGHAARLAADAQPAVSDLVLLGTPFTPVALTVLTSQPGADALRLLHRLLPPLPAGDPGIGGAPLEDADLALGRALVGSLIELTTKAEPAADLRPAATELPAPRTGLTVSAWFGAVPAEQVARAMTAVVAAGLASRAQARAAAPAPEPTGVRAGLRLALPATTTGALRIEGDALLAVAGYDRATGVTNSRALRVRLAIGDRLGWLVANAEQELRMVSIDATIPLGGAGQGSATVTLHDARVFGQSWERLVVGTGAGAVPLLPEARVLLATAVQRLVADAPANPLASAAVDLGEALGLVAAGGAVHDAFDHLVHDAAGLVRAALISARADLAAAISALLGPAGAAVDLAAGRISLAGGADTAGAFGWAADVKIEPAGAGPPLTGTVVVGAGTPGPAGGVQLAVTLAPFSAELRWYRPGGAAAVVPLWPEPDGNAIAAALAGAAPSLGASVALEVMRRADESVTPVIDAALDALGLLSGAAGDDTRRLRPLAGLLADPAGWLRSPDAIGGQPAKAQGLFDALRPLLGAAGNPGDPLVVAPGVTLSVAAEGPALRLSAGVDSGLFGGAVAGGRLAAGLAAGLVIGPSGPPSASLDLHVGLGGAPPGRQAGHAGIGAGGITVFLRPATGADIPLLPFAGLGGLAGAAAKALPFLLDELAKQPAPVGPAVAGVGDALALRSGTPKRFDEAALAAWATDPAAALVTALPSITATGLATLAPLLDGLTPPAVTVATAGNSLTATAGPITLEWAPNDRRVTLRGTAITVPGISRLSFSVALSDQGIDEVTATAGPAAIAAGGVTLRPFAHLAAGRVPAGGAGVALGLAVDGAGTQRVGARWRFAPPSFTVVVGDGPLAGLDTGEDPAAIAGRLVTAVIDLVASVAITQPAVTDLLDTTVGATQVRQLLAGVVLEDTAVPNALLPGVFDPATLLARVQRLFVNLAGAGLTVTVETLTISLVEQGGRIGVQLGLSSRMELFRDDVTLWLETDDSWIEGNPPGPGGLFVGVLRTGAVLAFEPNLVVNGVGLRIGRQSGPLLDLGLTLESVAIHAFAELDLGGARSGGARLELTNLAVSAGGASGGNAIAQGVVRDTGPQPPKPAFSPSLAIQKHGADDVHVTLRAGDGDGPWWIAIQKGFGPLYLEQVGFGVVMPSHRVERVSLLLDGSVSMFGLTCAVDDLQITYLVSRNDFFNPASWEIDLAGLAVSADMAGLQIAGGLLKSVSPQGDIEYLGMLLARFGVYGITIYGGYGQGTDTDGSKFVAFFAVGAVVGPIGGPPAFFLTGIGGGFGINRQLVVPTDLSRFGEYPLIQSLDVAASPGNPMEQLRALGQYFPMKKGTFWFAAGLSFTSFVIVDGIAVVAVEVGDGLDISLLGLARMALPRPQVALVSIEIALLVRFSSSEGVLWVQGQLTDNSYLLYRDVKLTGGFAYVIWFKGPNRGQFVLTMGGYHPDFHRDGYPEVPRLGLRWSVSSAIVVKAGGYFALTSEALMAGGDFEASAHFGPAWAEVRFGAHGIVYFDPFHYKVNAYARIAAGVTIDTWLFGEITISISIGATIEVEGPDFHGRATFDVGPVGLSVEFGSRDRHVDPPLPAAQFIAKYLDVAPGGAAQALAAITSFGAQPSGMGAPTPDGKPDRPFIVVAEFGLVVTTVVPAAKVRRIAPGGTTDTNHPSSRTLGVAPMDQGAMQPQLELSWVRGGLQPFPFTVTPRPFGAFPVGVWGPPQDDDLRPLPKGEVIDALCELDLAARATESPGGPQIPYFQVEIGRRKPLPFSRRTVEANGVRTAGNALTGLVTQPATVDAAFAEARRFLAATASPTGLAALRGERHAPPLVGTLGEGLDAVARSEVPAKAAPPPSPVVDRTVHAGKAYAFLPAAGPATIGDPARAGARRRTTVKDAARLWRVAPPTLASVEAARSTSVAAGLVVTEPPATLTRGKGRAGATVIATGDVPPTEAGRGRPAVVRTAGGDGLPDLRAFSAGLTGRTGKQAVGAGEPGHPGARVNPGDVAVLRLPNARRDVDPETARPRLVVRGPEVRIVAMADGAGVLSDEVAAGEWTVAPNTERLVVVGLGSPDQDRPLSSAGLSGWHAGMQLAYVGWSSALGPGCVVRTRGGAIGRHRERSGSGWVSGAELAGGVTTVTTRFAGPVRSLVLVLDDPAAFSGDVPGRDLVLGLAGATRVAAPNGEPRPPVVLLAENRTVLAYDVEPPAGDVAPPAVEVIVASEEGWSLAGVLGSADLGAQAAAALVIARGLDAATASMARGPKGASTLRWAGKTRRAAAKKAPAKARTTKRGG